VLGKSREEAEKNLKSVRGGKKVSLFFKNETQKPIKVFWIDCQGKRKKYRGVQPGQSRQQGTFEGHVWLIADSTDKALEVYVAGKTDSEVVIK
jgi:hypothetical protein